MFKKIAPDKWRHFYAGIVLGAVLQAFGYWLLPANINLSLIISSVIVITVSYGFELFSLFTGIGHYDFIDAVASIIGGAVGIGLAWVVFTYMLLPQF